LQLQPPTYATTERMLRLAQTGDGNALAALQLGAVDVHWSLRSLLTWQYASPPAKATRRSSRTRSAASRPRWLRRPPRAEKPTPCARASRVRRRVPLAHTSAAPADPRARPHTAAHGRTWPHMAAHGRTRCVRPSMDAHPLHAHFLTAGAVLLHARLQPPERLQPPADAKNPARC
jgi:hypothetical protein